MVAKTVTYQGKMIPYRNYKTLASKLYISRRSAKELINGKNLYRQLCYKGQCYGYNIQDAPTVFNRLGINRIKKGTFSTIGAIPKKGFTIKGYSYIEFLQEQIKREEEARKELEKKVPSTTLEETKKRARRHRYVDNDYILQNPVANVTGKSYSQLLTNIYIVNFDGIFYDELPKILDLLFSHNQNVSNVDIRFLLAFPASRFDFDDKGNLVLREDFDKEAELKYTQNVRYIDRRNIAEAGTPVARQGNGSYNEYALKLGYKIYINYYRNEEENEINLLSNLRELKAFEPSTNFKYHQMTSASTGQNRICIYESFLDIKDKLTLRYMRQNKENHDKIMTMLTNEGEEIETRVKNGELVNACELLTKKYDTDLLILFFNNVPYIKSNGRFESGRWPIYINKGKTSIMTNNDELRKYIHKKVMLYDENKHVAPAVFYPNIEKEEKDNSKIKKDKYILRKKDNIKNIDNNILVNGWDTETYLDNEKKAKVFCITFVGDNGEKVFYGTNAVSEFVNFLISISTKINNKKSRPKEEIKYIHVYGFNNCKFDNLFIYEKIYEYDRYCKIIFTGSAIKYIQFNNVRIYDISLYYKNGDLRTTCKNFKLEKEKGVYPYKFPNKNNLEYIGEVPELEYWNSESDRDEYIKINGNTFNMKEYTVKYCKLDSELVYELAKIHKMNCSGTIEERNFNVIKAPTSANMAVKTFQQVFQKEDLYQSPDEIVLKERSSYVGGRTEVFKKSFSNSDIELNGKKIMISTNKANENEYLNYYDINSAYPAGMTMMMPYKYLRTSKYANDLIASIDSLVNYNLYYAKSEYVGKDDHVIPNLLVRVTSGEIVACKNTDYHYHWGIELKEAISNGFKISIKEVNIYEGKKIFKEYSEYYYNKRLEVKGHNAAKACFFKALLNSLYGKWGQKLYTTTAMVNTIPEMYKILRVNNRILKSIEEINGKILFSYIDNTDEYKSIGKLVRFAAYISSTARAKLSEFMRDVGHEHVYYCDTDSCFTSKKPSDNFINNEILGKWKLEKQNISQAIFLAKKTYCYIDNKMAIDMKAKGFKNDKLTVNDYIDLSNGNKDKISIKMTMFYRALDSIKIDDESVRTMTTVYNNRIFDGNDSKAYETVEDWLNNKNKKNKNIII